MKNVITHAAEAGCYGLLVTAFFGDVMWTKFFWMPWIILAWGFQGAKSEPSLETAPPKPSP
jgi:hypothetical protein